jgi:hypothetical protein
MQRMTPSTLLVSVLILVGHSTTSAQERDPVVPDAASAGNLPADFYAKPGCARPEAPPVVKPVRGDQAGVDAYNVKVRRYNEAGKVFGACINAYSDRAHNDVDWIVFAVNTAVAKVNGSNPPAAPPSPGNMPANFYPAPFCIAPTDKVAAAPDPRNAAVVEAHNTKVRTFNALAISFNACIADYKTRAQADIARIEEAQNAAALEAKNQ